MRELETEPPAIRFHLAAECLTAGALVGMFAVLLVLALAGLALCSSA